MARINAGTLFAISKDEKPRKSSSKSFDFGWELVQSLTTDFIQQRPRNGLQKSILLKMQLVLGQDQPQQQQHQRNERGLKRRCSTCIGEIAGEGQKQKKDSLKKVFTQCSICSIYLCKNHLTTVHTCQECL